MMIDLSWLELIFRGLNTMQDIRGRLNRAGHDTAESQTKPTIRADQTLFHYAEKYIDVAINMLAQEKGVSSEEIDEFIQRKIHD